MQYELSDEEMTILLAGFQTMQIVGTGTARRVIALENRLVAEHDQAQKEAQSGT